MDSLIKHLIRDALQTGIFVALFALCDVGLSCEFPFSYYTMIIVLHIFGHAVAMGHTTLWAVFLIPLGRIYTSVSMTLSHRTAHVNNSTQTLMTTLVSRPALRNILLRPIDLETAR